MSHITNVVIQIKDLKALKSAAAELGLEFNEGNTNYRCWTQWLLDNGYTEDAARRVARQQRVDFDNRPRSVHSITLPGAYPQIGVYKDANGYTLGFDPWTPTTDNVSIEKKLGAGLEKLKQAYAVAKATIEAKAKGWLVQRNTLPSGAIKLTLSGV
jgi:hypothetical protein